MFWRDFEVRGGRFSYSVHACDDGEIRGCFVLGCHEETDSLGGGDVNHFGFGVLGVYAVYFDDAHLVAFNPEVLACKSADVDYAEHVCLAGLNGDGDVLRVVHEGGVGNGFSTSRVLLVDELRDERLNLIVVPVGKGEDDFLIHLLFVGELGIMDNDGTAKTIGVLAIVVRVVPVCSGLVDLEKRCELEIYLHLSNFSRFYKGFLSLP